MATTFTQGANSLFSITTPLGQDKVLLRGFRGSEGMSRLFRFELDLLSEDPNIDYTTIVGKDVTISLVQADGTTRYFNGYISRFGQSAAEGLFTSYHAEMVPWPWFLTRNSNCRIFQNLAVPDIVTQVFGALNFNAFTNSTKATYPTREYCVQYRESDFNFVSRLMEESGIYYFFQHDNGKHTLVMGDDPSTNADLTGQSSYPFYVEDVAVLDEDVINSWQMEQEMRTGKYSLTDYNFTTPASNLLASASTLDTVGGNTAYNTYDYPGKYLSQSDGTTLVKTRMEEEESVHLVCHGTSDGRGMMSGYKFSMTDHYRDDMNGSYLLTDIDHVATTTNYGNSKGAAQDHYSNSFRCIPAAVPFRPLRVTPHPTVMGPQPALVVGPSGEEIYTDKYGRIKVQFYWDQVGKKDENSSCWMRVSHAWAGANWGIIYIPRIGQEVMVDFLEGDPDQPLVTGRVYNAQQMPPYTLPDYMTQSGILTRSSKSGTSDNYNQLRFEDKKGSEEILIHAEKDMNRQVENNDSLTVGGAQTIEITGDRTETIDKGNETVEIKQGNRTHTIDTGNDTLTIKTGNHTVEVDTGNDSLTVKTGDRSVEVDTGNDTTEIKTGDRSCKIDMGNDSVTISMGNQTTTVSLGSISMSAMQSITLKVGDNSITIDTTGVAISGTMVKVTGQAQTQVGAPMIQISADGILQAKGGMVNINS